MFCLTKEQIVTNIKKIRNYNLKNGIDAFMFTSSDEFLNEYVPLEECQRYYFSGFTGSVGNILVTKKRAFLFVDGRYHEQADLEVDANHIEVVKVTMNDTVLDLYKTKIKENKIKTLGVDGSRIEYSKFLELQSMCKVKSVSTSALEKIVSFNKREVGKKVYQVESSVTGCSCAEKLKSIVSSKGEAIFISALDTIAWITNARGFHLPHQSTFLAKAVALREKIYLFIDSRVEIDGKLKSDKSIVIVPIKDSFEKTAKQVLSPLSISTLYFNKSTSTYSDYKLFASIFKKRIVEGPSVSLSRIHNVKNPSELAEMMLCFDKSDKAIFNSLKWLKENFANQKNVSEKDFYDQINSFYKSEGAIDQSFKTISGFGENSSVIHYSTPSSERFIKNGEFALLDSGAYYESGFATDTTRTCFIGDKPIRRHKEIYTMVLKGLIRAEKAVFPATTNGVAIDAMARLTLSARGYEYAHGTGHGVGINVHENSFRISPTGFDKIIEGQVGSIEPGIYIPGFGGVRLENIVVVKKHLEFKGMLCFEPLVFIGYDMNLVDQEMLTEDEQMYLEWYQLKCKEKGRAF